MARRCRWDTPLNPRRLLVVTPHFPPSNGADTHRVRVTLPFFLENGWEAEILTVDPQCIAVPKDPWLLAGVPDNISIHYSRAWSLRWSVVPGLGTLDFRAIGAVKRYGNHILRQKKFDLVYFSTTVFSLATLGPHWKKQFNVPYVIDYQDPWTTDYYRENRGVRPPGGRFKYAIVDYIARRQEPKVLRQCAGITAVSPAYPRGLAKRYPFTTDLPHWVAPFPCARRDFDRIESESVVQTVYDPHDGFLHWVYVGVSGPIMFKALAAFFEAIAQARTQNASWMHRLRLHFVGTSYAPAGQGVPVVAPLAEKFGVADIVIEQTDRIPYSETLRCLLDADALLVPGSDDDTYNASKLLPYLMAKKPMLAIFHRKSPAMELLRQVGGATVVAFDNHDTRSDLSNRIRSAWLAGASAATIAPSREHAADLYTDIGQARLLCEFFDQVVASSTTKLAIATSS